LLVFTSELNLLLPDLSLHFLHFSFLFLLGLFVGVELIQAVGNHLVGQFAVVVLLRSFLELLDLLLLLM